MFDVHTFMARLHRDTQIGKRDPRVFEIPGDFLPHHSPEAAVAMVEVVLGFLGKVPNTQEGQHRILTTIKDVLHIIEVDELTLCSPIFYSILTRNFDHRRYT